MLVLPDGDVVIMATAPPFCGVSTTPASFTVERNLMVSAEVYEILSVREITLRWVFERSKK